MPMIVGRIPFLTVIGLKASLLCTLLPGGCPFLHSVAQDTAASFPNEQTKESSRKDVRKMKVTVFYNLILEVTSLRNKSLGTRHTPEEETE